MLRAYLKIKIQGYIYRLSNWFDPTWNRTRSTVHETSTQSITQQTGVASSGICKEVCIIQGRIQDFKLGGGGSLKKIAPIGGRRENFWDISCEKSRFYAKKSYFFQS